MSPATKNIAEIMYAYDSWGLSLIISLFIGFCLLNSPSIINLLAVEPIGSQVIK